MKLLYVSRSIIFLLFLFFFYNVYSDTIGSTTSPSQEPYVVFLETPVMPPNEIIGFAWMVAGFELENSNTDLSYESLGQVTGPLLLNGGTMTLQANFITYEAFDWQTGGTIIGNNHSFVFSECESVIPTGNTTFVDTKLYLNNDITIEGTVTLQGDCEIIGNGYAITFGNSGELIIDSSATLTCSYTEFFAVQGNNICCVDDTGVIILERVSINLSDDFTFAFGAISFSDIVEISGEFIFDYTSALSSTILENSTLKITAGLEYKIGKLTDLTVIEPLVFADATSILEIDNGTLRAKDFGVILLEGQLFCDNVTTLITENVDSDYGIQFGDGTLSSNDFTLKISGGSTVNFESGFLIYNNTNPNGIIALSRRADVLRGSTASMVFKQNITLTDLNLQLLGGVPTQLMLDPGVEITYENVEVIVPIATFLLNGRQDSITSYHLDSFDSLFFDRGTLSLNILVHDGSNSLRGSGSLSGALIFDDSGSVLVWNLTGVMNNNIELNGGTISLSSDLKMVSGSITGGGIINLNFYNVFLPSTSPDLSGSITLVGSQGKVSLTSDTSISGNIHISGIVVLDCLNNALTITDTGSITIAPNSTLIIKNGYLKNIKNINIQCAAATSSVIFNRTSLYLTDDFSFAQGAFSIEGKSNIYGFEKSFFYTSSQESTVNSDSSLTIGQNVTFVYDPLNEDSLRLVFEDDTSQLILDNGIIFTPNTRLDLQNGELKVKGISCLISTVAGDYGFTFGDDITSDANMYIHITQDATLKIVSGSVRYANV